MNKKQTFWVCFRGLIVVTVILVVPIGLSILSFGLQPVQNTAYPLLAIASESMIPTLNVGDLIVVRGGLGVSEIVAAYNIGDIIVFHKPSDPRELIAHRAVERLGSGNNTYLRTKGDNNVPVDGWKIYDSHLIGKVVGAVPYIGHISLFFHTRIGTFIILMLMIAAFVLALGCAVSYCSIKSEKREKEGRPSEP